VTFARASRRDRGATIPIVALLLPVLILMVAFAIDLGIQRSNRRTMQARADIVALDLVRLADGRTEAEILNPLSIPSYLTLLNGSADRNEVPVSALTVDYGFWNGVTFTPALDTDVPNAVQVVAQQDQDYFFQPGSGHVTRTAVATVNEIAGFQVGSKLLSIDSTQSVLLNSLFNQTLGGALNLNALSYQGLIGANISLAQLAAELGFASPDELADATVGAGDFYLAAARVMENQGNLAAATVLETIATQTSSNTTLPVGDLIEVEQGGEDAVANASVDLFSLLTGSIFAIDGTSTLSIPDLTLALPGATSTITLNVTERPRIMFGRVGASVTTQQASIGIDTTLNDFGINVAGLAGVTVSGTIPMAITVAGATGTLTSIACQRPGIDVGLTPNPVSITAGIDLDISANVVLLGNVPIASATIAFTTPVGVTGTSTGASFLYSSEFLPLVGTGTMKPAPTTSFTLPGPLTLVPGSSLTGLGVIPVPLPALATELNRTVIDPISTALSAVVANQLNSLLGLNISGADIGALDMLCNGARLVD
jgi:uncharacterized membrane protein